MRCMTEFSLEQPMEILLVGKAVAPGYLSDPRARTARVRQSMIGTLLPLALDLTHHTAATLDQLIELCP